MHIDEIRRKTIHTFSRRRDYARAAKVYKSMEVSTNPKKKPEDPPQRDRDAMANSDLLSELEKALHYLQQVVIKLRGKE